MLTFFRRAKPEPGFFDRFPQFFSSSDTYASPNRLNTRYRGIIEAHADLLRGKRVLDLASHDGRWSFAALEVGAAYVLGIEARQHLVENAKLNVTRAEFWQGDVMAELDKLQLGQFDTIMCLGLLYHLVDHMLLFRKMARLKPSAIILDTAISTLPGCLVEMRPETTEHESTAAFGELGTPFTIAAKPTKAALELMARTVGYPNVCYYDWKNSVRDWTNLRDYSLGKRVTAVLTK